MNLRFLSSISDFVVKHSSNKKIFFYTLASILISGSMQFLEQMIPVGPGQTLPLKLDFRPFLTAKDITEVFQFYGESGRTLYFFQDVLDMFLPFAVCFMIGSFYSRAAIYLKLPVWINIVPFGFIVFDLIENSIVFYFLYTWPVVSETLAAVTGVITAIKLSFVFTGYGILIGSLFGLFLKYCIQKLNKTR
ncbi:hypothetical protein A0128_10075 [Leptospira tipperaryensis]|uniref:Uncharacterized protein n=1 Tax=Leptospira tipperaryensis TaxID=2564040 RepID=A0A1D7UX44_9LEPT|nr:hypothetical protein [Leptospira tipperaryensis]AOP34162.1 hypothetical protein A0128_10075 [Leptospira tipperaryensis]